MTIPLLSPSFFLGGFECSTHLRPDGVRLDLLRATRHDRHSEQDYRALKSLGIHAVRDGVRWHLIERSPGRYEWDSFLPMLEAAHRTGMRVVWDMCHYGWPPDIDIWSTEFPDRFAGFAAAMAAVVRDATAATPFYCPVNEISFWAWAGGDMRLFAPAATRRGMELKRQLVRAAIAGLRAIHDVDPRARIVTVDPLIHVEPKTPRARGRAAHARSAQYEAWDMLAGTLHPELGGGPDCLDIMGVNYYSDNQWVLNGATIEQGDPRYRPFRNMLAETYHRYRRPLFVAETGAEGTRRRPWFQYVCDEVCAALEAGVPVEGICLYPVTDYPGWADERHCECGLLGNIDAHGLRPVYRPLAEELSFQIKRFSRVRQAFAAPPQHGGPAALRYGTGQKGVP